MNNRILEELISHVSPAAKEKAEILIRKFGSAIGVFEAETDSLAEALCGDYQSAV